MYRLLRLFLLISVLLITAVPVYAGPRVVLDGNLLQFDTDPTIENGTTLVPLRKIFESLGATVQWDETTKKITAVKEKNTVTLFAGRNDAYINGKKVLLNTAPVTVNNRTLVPLRFISESFGAKVDWDQPQQLAIIKSVKPAPEPEQLPSGMVSKIHIINAGNANAVYVRLADGSNLLFDAGFDEFHRKNETIAGYLRDQDVDEIDLFVASSPLTEYIGAADEVLGAFFAQKVIESGKVLPTKDYETYKYALKTRSSSVQNANRQHFQFGDASVEILSRERYLGLTDDASVISRLTIGNIKVLFAANADLNDFNEIEGDISANIFLVPKHGHSGAVSKELLNRIKPEIAVISVGNNTFRDPSEDTLKLLKEYGARILRTDKDGNIVITTDGVKKSVSTEKTGNVVEEKVQAQTRSYIGDLDKNVYHVDTCIFAQEIPKDKRYIFNYVNDARAAGFIPCKVCNE